MGHRTAVERALSVPILSRRVFFHSLNIDSLLAAADLINIRNRRVFLSFKDCVDLLQRLALGLNPIDDLSGL